MLRALPIPPLNLLVLDGLGLLLIRRHPRLGRTCILVVWLLLYGLSTPLIGRALLRSLQTVPPLRPGAYSQNVGAIIVLGGGIYCNAPEQSGDSVTSRTLERLRYAAQLYRATGTPILASGGNPEGCQRAQGMVMKAVLLSDFHVPVQWVEEQSTNTLENARLSYALLQVYGITRIYLITHSWHMPRAVAAFEKAGFQVVPAPTVFTMPQRLTHLDFLPDSRALVMSAEAMHEWIGRLWYLWR